MDSRRVLITGGNGSLGQRLAEDLLTSTQGQRYHVVLLDDYDGFHKGVQRSPDCNGKATGTLEHVQADLARWDESWVSAFRGADAVVHFAAVNPYPEATWQDSRLSMRMGLHVLQASQRHPPRRIVLASSSHVMGGQLRFGAEVSEQSPPIRTDSDVIGFTQFRLPSYECDASAYAAAKLALEEAFRAAALAHTDRSRFSLVTVRIGWSQPGENTPQQMSPTATPMIEESAEAVPEGQGFSTREELLAWLHRLWLSNRDFKQVLRRAIEAELEGPELVVYGTSRNSGRRWTEEGWDALGYKPQDDAFEVLAASMDRRSQPRARL